MKSHANLILRRIRAKQRGWVFTAKDFSDIAPRNIIGVTLYRLVKKEIIRKIGYGIYDFPAENPKVGTLGPTLDAITSAIATRTGDTIQPSSAQLANQLGFDNQVPAKPTYITSGKPIKKKIANYPISFNHSKFLNKNNWSINNAKVIHALHYMGKDHITNNMIIRSRKFLNQRDKAQLKKNLKLLSYWMIPYILKIIRKIDLTLSKKYIGITNDNDPATAKSDSQKSKRSKHLTNLYEEKIIQKTKDIEKIINQK